MPSRLSFRSRFAILLVSVLPLAAQGLPQATPESVGLSSERLNRITAVVEENIGQKRIAGAVTLISRHGQVVWLKAQGMQDREAAKPMRPDSIFRICSMSKPVTSLAVMMLLRRGKVPARRSRLEIYPRIQEPESAGEAGVRARPTRFQRPAKSPSAISSRIPPASPIPGMTIWDRCTKKRMLPTAFPRTTAPLGTASAIWRRCRCSSIRVRSTNTALVSTCWVIWWRCFRASRLTNSCAPAFSNRWA